MTTQYPNSYFVSGTDEPLVDKIEDPEDGMSNYSAPLGSTIHLKCPIKLQPGLNRATAYPRVSVLTIHYPYSYIFNQFYEAAFF